MLRSDLFVEDCLAVLRFKDESVLVLGIVEVVHGQSSVHELKVLC